MVSGGEHFHGLLALTYLSGDVSIQTLCLLLKQTACLKL